MELSMNGLTFGFPGPVVDELEECNPILDEVPALRNQMETAGYLFIRGLIPRTKVLEARRVVLELLQREGLLKPRTELMDGIVNPEGNNDGGSKAIAESLQHDKVRDVLDGEAVRIFFDRYFSEPTFILDRAFCKIPKTARIRGRAG